MTYASGTVQPRIGVLLALLAAATFGVTTPIVQRAGAATGPFTTAALLYGGAALVALFVRRDPSREAPLRFAHAPRILAIAAAGAVLAPAALAWGLKRASGTSAGLLLSLEPVITVLLGGVILREHVGRRVALAALAMACGAALLVLRAQGASGGASALGLAAIVVATFGWALDNVLVAPIAHVDPARVVLAKASIGAALSLAIALALREPLPAPRAALVLAACGATGYGASLRLYLLAQRRLGAARTASVFGAAPFLAAACAIAMGQPAGGVTTLAAAALLLIGVSLHLTEKHAHAHHHHALEHEHAHRHDDAHHAHTHDPMPQGEHSHWHRHEPTEHAHPHAPDLHHDHRH